MDCIYYVVNIALFKVLFLHTNLIGGWSEEQMMVFVSCYLVVDAISMTVFSTNMWWLPFYINKGDLDYYLIRPVSPLFFLSLREFSANSFINLLMAFGIFIYSISSYSGNWEFYQLVLLLLFLLNGSFIHYCMHMLLILPVFWTHSSKGFVDMFYTLGLAMERPDRLYRGWRRVLFTVILPFGLIASFPARLFLESFSLPILTQIVVVTIVLWLFMLFVWNRGLKNYSSASS
jgi:ABC-2 type transport system permease protein